MNASQALHRLRMYFPYPVWTVDIECRVFSYTFLPANEPLIEFQASAWEKDKIEERAIGKSEKSLALAVAACIQNRKATRPALLAIPNADAFFSAAESEAA